MTIGYRLRGGTLAAASLALSLCACRTVHRPATRTADRQEKSRHPPADEMGGCRLAKQEMAELNRQIARLSALIATAAGAIEDLRSSRDEAAHARAANGSITAAQQTLSSSQQSCRMLLQSIEALNDLRADLARSCPIAFDRRDIPAASVCD